MESDDRNGATAEWDTGKTPDFESQNASSVTECWVPR